MKILEVRCDRRLRCDDQLSLGSTPQSPSARAARSSVYDPRWAASATASTMRWPKASSRLLNARCWIEITSRLGPKHAGRSSRGSRVGIIGIADTRPSGTFHRRSSSDASPRTHSPPSAACAADRAAVKPQECESRVKRRKTNRRSISLTQDRPWKRGHPMPRLRAASRKRTRRS